MQLNKFRRFDYVCSIMYHGIHTPDDIIKQNRAILWCILCTHYLGARYMGRRVYNEHIISRQKVYMMLLHSLSLVLACLRKSKNVKRVINHKNPHRYHRLLCTCEYIKFLPSVIWLWRWTLSKIFIKIIIFYFTMLEGIIIYLVIFF